MSSNTSGLDHLSSSFISSIEQSSCDPRSSTSINRESVVINKEVFSHRIIHIKSLLSEEECSSLMRYVDEHDDKSLPRDHQLRQSSPSIEYRNDRTLFAHSSVLAQLLMDRIQPILDSYSEHVLQCSAENKHLFLNEGLGMKGTWKLDSINPGFRFSKYDPHGHFSPHYDSDRVEDPLYSRSLKTLIVYLNDSYKGGETNFIQPYNLDIDYSEKKIPQHAPEEFILGRVKAKAGDCVLFDHKILHEGAVVVGGCKYTLRSDVMYRRDKPSDDDLSSLSADSIREEEAIRLFHDGMREEGLGNINQAIALYRRACKLCPQLEKGV
jgi:predicted 2-oxoglutarate/Fe(II)-dependent dioxygenase YbiX